MKERVGSRVQARLWGLMTAASGLDIESNRNQEKSSIKVPSGLRRIRGAIEDTPVLAVNPDAFETPEAPEAPEAFDAPEK